MMQALAATGHEVALLTKNPPLSAALEGLSLIDQRVIPTQSGDDLVSNASLETISQKPWRQRWTWRQERFRSYWGIDEQAVRFTRDHAERLEADVVVVAGLEVLPYLCEIRRQTRVWYAADEWVWHHLSLIHPFRTKTWSNLREALVLGLYEHSFASTLDRIWVVSETDKRAMNLVTRTPAVDLIPNGVSTTMFSPTDDHVEPNTCTFWGNLAFAPNEQALNWFCHEVWPLILRDMPNARFNIYGFNPSPVVLELAQVSGVSITPNVPSIRDAVSRQSVVVLPFVSGGGIKNKLLEAASLAMPTVCSPRASNGLNTAEDVPFVVVPLNPRKWAVAIQSLWNDADTRQDLGTTARQWVINCHSWEAAAASAIALIDSQ